MAFPFPDENFHGGAAVSPLFHHLSEKLLNCYQSIDFLCKLNKTRELKTEILKEGNGSKELDFQGQGHMDGFYLTLKKPSGKNLEIFVGLLNFLSGII